LRLIRLLFSFIPTAPPEIYTLSLHDALPISSDDSVLPPMRRGAPSPTSPSSRSTLPCRLFASPVASRWMAKASARRAGAKSRQRSEEHTSELQSPCNLVCRLLLEKKKKIKTKLKYKKIITFYENKSTN